MPPSTFDPEIFEQAVIEEANETSMTPVPEAEYDAFIDKIEFRDVNDTPVLEVHYRIIDEALKEELGLEDIMVRQSVWLDATIEDGKLLMQQGPNKNVQLGRLREACGQNKPGAWTFSQLTGQGPLLIQVGQRLDKKDPSIIYNDIKRVSAK